MLLSVWRGYQRLLVIHPLKTQMISAGLLAGIGDATAQLLIEKKRLRDYDVPRTGRFVGVTCFWITPILSRWLVFLQTRVGVVGNQKIAPLKRVVVDQLGMSPVFLSSILIWLRLLDGEGPRRAVQRWRDDFWEIWRHGLAVWPLAMTINFYLVPPPLRLVFSQTVALFWNTYLAWRTNLSPLVFVSAPVLDKAEEHRAAI